MQYGYINESGYLVSRDIVDSIELYTDENGERKQRVIPASDIAEQLSENGWKPVKDLDESKLVTDEGYFIKALPYDAGECIDFRYEKRFDARKYQNEIQRLKNQLTAGDYKITKCYEANLMGDPLPYNIQELHAERQLLRDKINELENYYNEMVNGK